jgi:Uma2 family endonuclease
LRGEIGGLFDWGAAGPGGWHILIEPEIHFPDPTAPGEIDALVPDVAGWRRERVSVLPDTAFCTIAPDWICEVSSPSTTKHDRELKMPVYAREGVRHAWLIEPIAKTQEVYTLGRWSEPVVHQGEGLVRAEPFDAIGLDLSALWT